MKAIILAAGMGTRLGTYTKDLPKCMLSFDGKTLIERQVATLQSAGIVDITIVKGYMSEKITIPNVKMYINTDFANTNMVESLFCAEEEMTEDLLVCYSDILYEDKVVRSVLNSSAHIGVAVDNDYWDYWSARLDNPLEDIESLVIGEDGSIVELGDTHCAREQANIRYVGIIKFSAKGLQSLKEVYHRNKHEYYQSNQPWQRSPSFRKAYMTCMLQAMINSGNRVTPVHISHGWLEFDTVADYERAREWKDKGTLDRFISLAS